MQQSVKEDSVNPFLQKPLDANNPFLIKRIKISSQSKYMEYMHKLSDHFDNMKYLINLDNHPKEDKSLSAIVESHCLRSITEFSTYLNKIVKDNTIVS